jgi:hypothetical protein
MTRAEAATIALYRCGGDHDAVHTEDIAINVAAVAPGMFSWEKYPEFIDKELVRVALSDARLKKHYLVGSHDKGWLLTPSGIQYASAVPGETSPQTTRGGKTGQQHTRERNRLLTSEAFQKFASDAESEITDDEADAFFRLNLYVRGQARLRKITRIENEFGNDSELGDAVVLLAEWAKRRA